MAALPSHPRGSASTFKTQEGVPAKADLEEMRVQTDALVSSFNERYRDTILTPVRLSAPRTPNNKSLSQSAETETAAAVHGHALSPYNDAIVRASILPLSSANPKNISPFPMRQQASAAPPATPASSSDQIYFRAMLTQAHAESAQMREALVLRDQQLSYANTQIGELRRAIALRDGCLQHANSVVAQLQEHKLHLYSIIDNFRAQQAASKSQLDLQARSLINKERHIFTLTEKIQRLKLESANHHSSCEEALQFMVQECQSASRDRDAALSEVMSLRLQSTDSKSIKGSSMANHLGSASRKALLASLDVGSGSEHLARSYSSMSTARAMHSHSIPHEGETARDLNIVESPPYDNVVDFYLALSHEKGPLAAMIGSQASPAGAKKRFSPDCSKKKLLDLFGDVSSTRTSQDGSINSDQHNDVEVLAVAQEVADHNSQISSTSLLGSSRSSPALQSNLSASKSKTSPVSASIDSVAGFFTNQQRRRTAARSLAGKCLTAELKFMLVYILINV
jgi:hypothetical protein